MLNDVLPSDKRPNLPPRKMAAPSLCQCSPDAMVFPWWRGRGECTQHEGVCQNLLSRAASYLPGRSGTVSIRIGHMLAKRKIYVLWETSWEPVEAAAWSRTVATCLGGNV